MLQGVNNLDSRGIKGEVIGFLSVDAVSGIQFDEELLEYPMDGRVQEKCSVIAGLPSCWQMPERVPVVRVPGRIRLQDLL